MRIYVHTTASNQLSAHCSSLIDFSIASMPQYGHIMTADYPDLVHIWGAWDKHTIKEIHCWQKTYMPVVFSSSQGLAALCNKSDGLHSAIKRNAIKTICRLADVIIVQGPQEHALIKQISKTEATILLNPFVTSLISEQEAASILHQTYTSLYESHDSKMKSRCQERARQYTSDEIMVGIISHILYIKYLFRHGTCYDTDLKQLAENFMALDTDENVLSDTLQRMKMQTFAQHLMAIMEKRGYLTEGFMPVEKIYDKHSKQMDETIRQREKQ